jgi:Tol biopolymer transport system component
MKVRGYVRARTAALAIGTIAISGLLPVINAHAVDPGKNGYVAFVLADESTGAGGIYTMLRDGTGTKRIVNDPGAGKPAWSPDGKQIAFVRDYGNGDRPVMVMNADGSDQHQLLPGSWTGFVPGWQPLGAGN